MTTQETDVRCGADGYTWRVKNHTIRRVHYSMTLSNAEQMLAAIAKPDALVTLSAWLACKKLFIPIEFHGTAEQIAQYKDKFESIHDHTVEQMQECLRVVIHGDGCRCIACCSEKYETVARFRAVHESTLGAPNQFSPWKKAVTGLLAVRESDPTEMIVSSSQWTSAVTTELRRREAERNPKIEADYPDDNWPNEGE